VFLESLQRLLPVLHRIASLRTGWPNFSRDKLGDLEKLYSKYRTFLAEAKLFEPNYERPRLQPGEKNYLLFFPELIEDFSEFADLIAQQAQLTCVPIPVAVRKPTAVQVFETLPEEIRTTMLRVAELLDNRSDPHGIILTVGELEELEPLLRREAELFAIPLQIHRGKPLSDFPQGKFFQKVFSSADSSFSVTAMKALLLCRSIPWKQERLCNGLIRLGLDSRIVRNTAAADSWHSSIESARLNGNPRKLPLRRISGFYTTLKNQIMEIADAGSFSDLKKSLVSFSASFLDLTRLSDEELKIFQYTLDSLDELDRAEEFVSVPQTSIFRIWWIYLDQRLYVPRQNTPGISVYPYRVSEGMYPEQHFVINASQAATSHTPHRYPFLKLHEEQYLGDVQKDLSAAHLQLYSHSGEKVSFSYSRRDYRRSNLPPPLFLRNSIAAETPKQSDYPDPYDLERNAWIEGNTFPLQPTQKYGYLSAAAGALAAKRIDITSHQLLDKRLIHSLQNRLRNEEGLLRISSTELERFSLCPFQFLFEHLLHVGSEEYEPMMIDPRDFGILMHRVLQAFFHQLVESDARGKLFPDRREEYRERIRNIVSKACIDFRNKNLALLEPIWDEMRLRAEELALTFLDVDFAVMSEEQTQGCEIQLQVLLPDIDSLLVGKIDRINNNPTGHTVVDYKKKHVPNKADIFSDEPESMQMPFYIYLMNENNLPVSRAAFYSFENGRYHFVLGGPRTNMADADSIDRSIELIKRRIFRMRDRILSGDFRIENSSRVECSRCRLPEICRHQYLL
jgi:RecB family exonuclease